MKLVRTRGPHFALIFIAPALDVVLTLIFFLILSTSFLLQPGVAVAVPDSPFLLAPQRDPQVISITSSPTSSVYFENREVDFGMLRSKLEGQHGRARTVIIKADRLASFDLVAKVMAISLGLGYPTVVATADGK